jgi:hypothetical protein
VLESACETPAFAINTQTKEGNIIIFTFGPFRDGVAHQESCSLSLFPGHRGAQATTEQTSPLRAARQPWAAVSGVARRSPVTVRVGQCSGCPFCAQNSGAVSASAAPALVSAVTTATLATAASRPLPANRMRPIVSLSALLTLPPTIARFANAARVASVEATSEATGDVSVAQ